MHACRRMVDTMMRALPSLPAKRQHATLAAHAQESAADLAVLVDRLRDEGEHAAACYYQRRAAARYACARVLVANCSE